MKYWITLLYIIVSYTADAQLPVPASGKIVRHENFSSVFVTSRHIDVWLPEGYDNKKKYAVLYMHDGQMLYDANTTWNKQEWGVDETLTLLKQNKKMRECIVVGVWNGGPTRHADYFPQKPFESLGANQKELLYTAVRNSGQSVFQGFEINSDNYLRFLVKELKPFIDKTYSTYSDRANTFIAGSSMGGLISMYALCEYPEIFGGAACLSTHWPGIFNMENNPLPDAFISYLKAFLPSEKNHKIYFDTGDQTLDALYPPIQKRVDDVMKARGYTKKHWITKYDPGADHSENSWKKRLDIPLAFLLK